MAEQEFDILVVLAEDDKEREIDDIIHRYGAFKMDYEEDNPDQDDEEIESMATGRKDRADEVNEEERERERDMNVSTPR